MKHKVFAASVIAMLSWPLVAASTGNEKTVTPIAPLKVIGSDGRVVEQPLVDVTKNPGCGVKASTPEARLERNRNLARHYYQAYAESADRRAVYGLSYHGCMADDVQIYIPMFYPTHGDRDGGVSRMIQHKPDGSPNTKEAQKTGETREMQIWWKYFTDWRMLSGTFIAFPSDQGFYVRGLWGGRTKDGKWFEFWEVDSFRVNDDGKITYAEYWNDLPGIQATADYMGLGDLSKLGVEGYAKAIEAKLAEK